MKRKISLKVVQLFQKYIGTAVIYIGSTSEFLLVAAVMHNHKSIKVSSDKGIEHLLLLLCKAISPDSVEIDKVLASAKYHYPISISADNLIEKMLVGAYTTITCKEGDYTVLIQRTMIPSPDSLPGVYNKTAEGVSIEAAFLKLQNISFALRS